MAALIGWLDDVPVFQYEVVRHKISLQCRGGGGGGGQGGQSPTGNPSCQMTILTLLSYDTANPTAVL